MNGENKVKLTINGKPVEVEEGTTILEAAKELDIDIPTLCYHPVLEPYAACRVCVVERTMGKRTDLVTSCNTKVQEGMVINIETPYYKLGFGASHFEDTMLITSDGAEDLISMSLELKQISVK